MHNHRLSLSKTTSRWQLLLMSLLMLLVTAQPAQAKIYTFSGGLLPILGNNLPTGCKINSILGVIIGNTYNCGGLTLADGDTVTIIGGPITINFSGIFNTGAGTQINVGGTATNLNLVLQGALNVGISTKVVANVADTAMVNLGANSEVSGTITTTTTTGIITTGDSSRVGGTINAEFGAITIGPNSTVNGAIIAKTGAVTIGNYSLVHGKIEADTAAITLGTRCVVDDVIIAPIGVVTIGANSTVSKNVIGGLGAVTTNSGVTIVGNITTTAGVVTIGADNTVGDIISGDGGITINDRSVVGTISSSVGVINILNYVTVSGEVKGGVGAVNIETYSRICGNVIISGAGILTLTTDINVGGNITTTVGAITVGAGSTVNRNVTISGAGVLTMTSVQIGGNVSTVTGVITLSGSRVRGDVESLAVATITNSIINDLTLFVPPACGVAPPPGGADFGSTATGLFDCLETGGQTASLYTKLAGTAFSFDIAALNADKTIKSNYVAAGDPPKYTRVELFDDATSPASCAAYASPVAVQKATFTSSSAGRIPTGNFNLSGVYKKLRCRVTECTNINCITFIPTAEESCSSDQFSVRPVAVSLMSSANAVAPSSTLTPLIKADAGFNLSASTSDLDNYSGLLTLDVSKLTAQNPINDTTLQTGGVVGTLTPATLTANTAVSNATYSEVGYLYLAPGAYRDDSFTAVDSGKSDCIINSLSDSLSSGQYGCSIGNTAALTLGRFIHDHFGVVGSVVTRSELQLKELQKLPFTYMEEPMQLTLVVTAYNKSEGATFNYQGKFAKLNTTDWSAADLSNWTCIDVSCMGLSATSGSMPLTERLAIDTTVLNSQVPSNTTTPEGSIDGWSYGSSYFTVNILLKRYVNPDINVNPTGSMSPDGSYDKLILGAKPQDLEGVTLPPKAPTDIRHCVDLNALTGDEDADCKFDTANETDLRRKVVETKVRFGRLSLGNAYGSELQNLIIPVEVQYWNGSSFVRNDDDNNTPLADSNIVVGNYQGGLLAKDVTLPPTLGTFDVAGNCIITDTTKNGVISGGKSCILFYKPSISGSVDLLINLGLTNKAASCFDPLLFSVISTPADRAYLRGNWCVGNYDRDPTAHITFGLYKGNGSNRLIYFREVY